MITPKKIHKKDSHKYRDENLYCKHGASFVFYQVIWSPFASSKAGPKQRWLAENFHPPRQVLVEYLAAEIAEKQHFDYWHCLPHELGFPCASFKILCLKNCVKRLITGSFFRAGFYCFFSLTDYFIWLYTTTVLLPFYILVSCRYTKLHWTKF